MSDDIILSLSKATKLYAGIPAIDGVDFDLRRGEIHALVGENGAGKSTLTKVMAGVVTLTSGTMAVDGAEVSPKSPLEARQLGVAMVFQENSLVPTMTVAQNLKLEAYQNEVTRSGRPKNENLVNRIDTVALAAIRAFFTDEDEQLPAENERVWWEIWLRADMREPFQAAAAMLDIPTKPEGIVFPEREVVLAFASLATLGGLLTRTDAIAEIRLARDTPAMFLAMRNLEQAEWARELLSRLDGPDPHAVAVTILDSGVTHTHPLLAIAIRPEDVHTYDPTWPAGDSAVWGGHGTAMSGVALYGELHHALASHGRIRLDHRLESVKMLHPDGVQHEPHLYGAITAECVSRAEIAAPRRPRAICMAVTSDTGVRRGKPSSWSATVDRLSFGDDTARRLFLLCAGNVSPDVIPVENYLARTDVEPVLNPAQAWNALQVGAFTEKTNITDPTFW